MTKRQVVLAVLAAIDMAEIEGVVAEEEIIDLREKLEGMEAPKEEFGSFLEEQREACKALSQSRAMFGHFALK
jgi:hypothetical protein